MQCLLDALKLHSTTSKTCKGNEVLPEEKSISGTPCLDIDAELVNRVQICASLNEIDVVLGEDFSADPVCETLICKLCVPNVETQPELKHNVAGTIGTHDVENTKQGIHL